MITCITRYHDSRSDSSLYSMRVTTKVSIYNIKLFIFVIMFLILFHNLKPP